MSNRETGKSSRRSRSRKKESVSDNSSAEDVEEVRNKDRKLITRRPVSANDLRLPEYRQYSGDEKERKKLHRREKKITRNAREERTREYVMTTSDSRNITSNNQRVMTTTGYRSDGDEEDDDYDEESSETGTESTVRRVKDNMRFYTTTDNGRTMSDTGDQRKYYSNTYNNGRPMSDVGARLVEYVRHDSLRERRHSAENQDSGYSQQIMHTLDGDKVVELRTREEGNKIYYNYRLKEEPKPPVRHVRNVGVQMTTKYVPEQQLPPPVRNAATQTPAPPSKPRPKTPPKPRPKTPPPVILPPTPPPVLEVMEPVPAVIPKVKSMMVRVGGGWMKVEHHRNHHIPVRVYEHNRQAQADDKFLFIKSRFARKKRQVPIAYKRYREKIISRTS